MGATDDLNRPIGFWRALGDFRLKEVLWPEGVLALLFGAGGAALALSATTLPEREDVVGTVLALAGGLFGVVFAALAIVVSLPSTSYLRMLGQTPQGGMRLFLDPFLVAAGTQVTIVVLAIAYRIIAEDVATWAEQVGFCALGFIFMFGLLDIVALARQLVRHGVLRAVDAVMEAEERDEQNTTLRRLPRR